MKPKTEPKCIMWKDGKCNSQYAVKGRCGKKQCFFYLQNFDICPYDHEPSKSGLKPQSLPRSSVDTRIGSDNESPKDSEIVEKVLDSKAIERLENLVMSWSKDENEFDTKMCKISKPLSEIIDNTTAEARKDCLKQRLEEREIQLKLEPTLQYFTDRYGHEWFKDEAVNMMKSPFKQVSESIRIEARNSLIAKVNSDIKEIDRIVSIDKFETFKNAWSKLKESLKEGKVSKE